MLGWFNLKKIYKGSKSSHSENRIQDQQKMDDARQERTELNQRLLRLEDELRVRVDGVH